MASAEQRERVHIERAGKRDVTQPDQHDNGKRQFQGHGHTSFRNKGEVDSLRVTLFLCQIADIDPAQ